MNIYTCFESRCTSAESETTSENKQSRVVEELKTNLMSLIVFIVRFAAWSTSASSCKTDTTKHHPQQTPTHNDKKLR